MLQLSSSPVRLVALLLVAAATASAKPNAPALFCAKYPTAPTCVGTLPPCTMCHVAAPQRNVFGAAIEVWVAPGAARPLSDADFGMALPAALSSVEALDSDADNVSNLAEIQREREDAEKAARDELKKKQKTIGNGGARNTASEPKPKEADKPAPTPPPSPMLSLFDSPAQEEADVQRPISTGEEVNHASQSDAP